MQFFIPAILLIAAYLLGSFSSAVWFGKWFRGIDLREHGSGNAGATNAFRVLGAKIAIPVFVTDIAKAFAAVMLSSLANYGDTGFETDLLKIGLGIAAVTGHIFPIFSGFKGGKGVASMLGVILAINPVVACCSLGVFVLFFLIFRIVSVGSIMAAISFPIFTLFIFSGNSELMGWFSVVAAFLIIALHYKNIRRLIRGNEKQISFKKKPDKN